MHDWQFCTIFYKGGNAGLAAAYSARKLNIACTIVVPSTTPGYMIKRLEEEGAEVIVHGNVSGSSPLPSPSLDPPLKTGLQCRPLFNI